MDKLKQHQALIASKTLKQWFEAEPHRVSDWTLQFSHLYLDLSKNYVNAETKNIWAEWWQASDLKNKIKALQTGERINTSENRQVLHHILREPTPSLYADEILATRQKMQVIENKLKSAGVTDVVHIGIGGSELGMKLLCQALRSRRNKQINIHFLASPDADKIAELQETLHPKTTALIVASKTFTTEETMVNAQYMRDWLLAGDPNGAQRMIAISTAIPLLKQFGILEENVLPMWDWVGGRFSLSSALALPLVLQNSFADYEALLRGLNRLDEHFYQADFKENLPVLLATLDAWYNRYFHIDTRAVITYNHPLHYFPAYLQQLAMESLGKNVDIHGKPLSERSGIIIWGGNGTETQHSFFQLLHQGNHIVPLDLITVKSASEKFLPAQATVHSHFIAQAEAFMLGRKTDRNEQFSAGNRPTSALILDELNPESLGELIALYEHKTSVEGFLYGINSYDQWGVEFGKILAKDTKADLLGAQHDHDASTSALIQYLKQK